MKNNFFLTAIGLSLGNFPDGKAAFRGAEYPTIVQLPRLAAGIV
ncbi:hypothetical protein [Novosphingobium profundi]|nr:hypothetical protein [Novosphingobium profundi]